MQDGAKEQAEAEKHGADYPGITERTTAKSRGVSLVRVLRQEAVFWPMALDV